MRGPKLGCIIKEETLMGAVSKNAGPGRHRFPTVRKMSSPMQSTRRGARRNGVIAFLIAVFTATAGVLQAAPANISFSQSATPVDAYNFLEITVNVSSPDVRNPFTEASVTGKFEAAGQAPIQVQGFCDSGDGSVFRIRFMPSHPGEYTYKVIYKEGGFTKAHNGNFRAIDGHLKGILRVDPKYPWHFIWEGTGQHYFWNGTTAFLMMGWKDDKVIRSIIDRLSSLEVNRIRVLLSGRAAHSFWGEPIVPSGEFQPFLNVWVAARPASVDSPGFDFKRFNVKYFQKWERMLKYARSKDMIISVIMEWNDSKVHPAALSEDEKRYFSYAAARFSAFPNITWDLGDDISSFRSLVWSHEMGALLVEKLDPYHHLGTDHPVDNTQQDRTAKWFGFTSFQEWHQPYHPRMLDQRKLQAATGRIIPQVDEEYGYEDHYPIWSPNFPDGQSAEDLRRAAWEFAMAGTYQTTGETAKRGTGVWPDTGGGWVNGRGDSSMVMLRGYAHMADFFTSFDWWKTNPDDSLVTHGDYCLAAPGNIYVIYLPMAGSVTAKLEAGSYKAEWFNPRTGKKTPLPDADGRSWSSPMAADSGDWAILLQKK
jgi:Protein of unknown function (DUF4038)/Domain of unknown function (DUF5060)/Putative collagen-binding domain of a collagenase